MKGRLHLCHNLPLPSRFLHWYQLILLGDRGTMVWTSCLRSLCSSVRAGVEPATSRSLVLCCTCSATASRGVSYLKLMFCYFTTFTQHRGVAKNVGCFQRNLFVCMWVCGFVCFGCVCRHDSFRTSKQHRTTKLVCRCIVQKSRPSSNFGVIAPVGAHPQKCGIRLWRWENQRRLSSFVIPF